MMQKGNLGCKFMDCLPAMRGLLVYFTMYQQDTSETQKVLAKERLEKLYAEKGWTL